MNWQNGRFAKPLLPKGAREFEPHILRHNLEGTAVWTATSLESSGGVMHSRWGFESSTFLHFCKGRGYGWPQQSVKLPALEATIVSSNLTPCTSFRSALVDQLEESSALRAE